MAAAKGASRVGRNMKPRGEQAEKPADGESVIQEGNKVSTDQVQAEGTEGAKSEVQGEAETPTNQEADEAIRQAADSPAIASLAGMLRQSAGEAEKTPEVKPNLEPEALIEAIKKDEHDRHDEHAEVEGGQTLHPPYTPGESVGGYDIQFDHERGVLKMTSLGVGLRPNNDFGVVITIPEYFVGSVKDFAEADGNKPVEQWCSEFFLMNLEAYCAPNKGR